MTEILELTTAEGRTVSCQFTAVEGISQTLTFFDMQEPDDVDYWRSYFEDYCTEIAQHLLEHVTTVKLSVSCNGNYEQHDTGQLSEPIVMNSKFPTTLTRHTIDLERKVEGQFLAVHDPSEYYMRLQEQFGSNIGHLENYNTFTMSFLFPYEFNVRALPTSFRLRRCALSGFLDFLPYNNDDYCILHCLFPGEKPADRKSLNANKDYTAAFTTWFETNSLGDFYIDGFFNLDVVEKLEDRLGVNINFYTFEAKKPELYYRSGYRQVDGPVFHLVVVPMELFFDNNKAAGRDPPKTVSKPIIPCGALDEAFRAAINIKNVIRKRAAHCAVLKLTAFSGNRDGEICEYCTGTFSRQNLEAHRLDCRNSFSGGKRDRIKVFRDPLPGQDQKVFSRYVAKYRVPFAVYDFETKPIDRHVAFSYSILYLNIFDYSKSIIALNSNQDPEVLISEFLEDIASVAKHHYRLQSVDLADPVAKANAEIPLNCPFCLEEIDEDADEETDPKRRKARKLKAPEYNHTHFRGDNKNKHLDGYVCKACNVACTIKDKPLVFYGHNASRYDHNFFTEALVNSADFSNFTFLSKTESRFSQIGCSLASDTRIKLLFGDSRMMLAGSLSSLAKSWITKEHTAGIKSLLGLYYPGKDLDELAAISGEKQVFPYTALCHEDLLASTEPIPREHFRDNLYDRDVSEEDYASYINANSRLKAVIGEVYTFLDYHDYYLAVDCITLALVLHNFAETAYEMNKIWPITWYVSISGYSFGALLANNKYSLTPTPKIEIPKAEVQRYLQRSVRGGVSRVFHKQPPNFNRNRDMINYLDVNSMYSSICATRKLPHKFRKWWKTEGRSVESIIAELETLNDNLYHFVEVDIAPLAEEHQEKASLFPLFPENVEIKPEWLSEDQRYRYSVQARGKEFEGDTINCMTFFEKKNYVCSWSYLKFAISLGAEVSTFHTIAEFHAAKVMSEYTENTYQLKKDLTAELNQLTMEFKAQEEEVLALPEEEQALIAEEQARKKEAFDEACKAISGKIAVTKILLCGTFGSTIIRQDLHSDTKLFDTTSDLVPLKKAVSSLRFKSLLHAGGKTLVCSDKSTYINTSPISLGSAILWESKILMLTFVYSLRAYLKDLGLSLNLLYTDTDSVVFHIPDFRDVFESFDELSSWFNEDIFPVFDTRFNAPEHQHPETHEAFSMFKNEVPAGISEFNGVCSKVYSYLTNDDKSGLRAKGVSKTIAKKLLSNALYHGVIVGTEVGKDHVCEFGSFSSKQLGVSTVRVKKSYVSLVDLKSWYGENGTAPIVFGSKAHFEKMAEAKARLEEVHLETP